MATIATISSSPSDTSRTDAVLSYVTKRLLSHGHRVTPIVLRDLPAAPLLRGQADDPSIARAVDVLAAADAVVVTTPVYKAAYSGLLKVFLDLLPQYALRGKTVLPLATGGTPAHVLVIDYALRPVLTSLGAAWGDRAGLVRVVVPHPPVRRRRVAAGSGCVGAALPGDRRVPRNGRRWAAGRERTGSGGRAGGGASPSGGSRGGSAAGGSGRRVQHAVRADQREHAAHRGPADRLPRRERRRVRAAPAR